MDSNKNKECCYSNGGRCASGGLTVVIGTDCISKAVSAAKYQNQFNNNNLIEQENLMPPVHDRVSGMVQDDSSTSTLPKENGIVASSESPVKDKVLAENGSSRHITSIFNQSSTPIVSAGSDIPSDRTIPSLQSSVDFFSTSTSNVTNSFNPTGTGINGTSTNHLRSTVSIAHESNGFVQPTVELASNGGTGEPPDESCRPAAAAEIPVKLNANDDSCPPDEGDFSDNNSLGNLSYVSENGLIEEIILLPNNAYSDDDNASTSDDCIYAYRGGEPDGAAGQLLDLQGDLPPDDETDFLEMDFDPEPSSEMENFNRQSDFILALDEDKFAGVSRTPEGQQQQQQENVGNGSRSRISSPTALPQHSSASHEPSGPLHRECEIAQKGNETGIHHVSEANDGRSLLSSMPVQMAPCVEESKEQRAHNTDITKGNDAAEPTVNRPHDAHNTGAIPKSLPLLADCPSVREGLSINAKNLRLELSLHPDEPDSVNAHRYTHDAPFYYKSAEFGVSKQRPKALDEGGEDTHCLDCAEQEFLMRTKQDPSRQRYCNACKAVKQEGRGRMSGKGATTRSYGRVSDREEAREGGFYAGANANQPVVDDELMDRRAEQIVYETLHKINTLKEMPPTGGLLSRVHPYQSKGTTVPCVLNAELHEEASQQVPHAHAKKVK
uniref:Uncharacterized protein n=1 Tax=Anopheles maculatus TaxID=74869 RepID=A0A182T9J4_9DIPT